MSLVGSARSPVERATGVLRAGGLVLVSDGAASWLVASPGCLSSTSTVDLVRHPELAVVLPRDRARRLGLAAGSRIGVTLAPTGERRSATLRAVARSRAARHWFSEVDGGVGVQVIDRDEVPTGEEIWPLAAALTDLAGLGPTSVVARLDPRVTRTVDEAVMSTVEALDAGLRDIGALEVVGSARLPTPEAVFQVHVVRGWAGEEHVALALGPHPERGVVRVLDECRVGHVFWTGCGCRGSLDAAMAEVAEHGEGLVLYLRDGRDRASDPCPAARAARSDLAEVRRAALVRAAIAAVAHPAG